MADTVKTIAALLVVYVALPLTILILWDRVRSRRRSPARPAAESPPPELLLQPDWPFYEHHLQRPVPEGMRELYKDARLISAQDIDYGGVERLNSFVPLRADQLLDTHDWLSFDIAPIAITQFGDPIYLRPGKDERDEVFITHHDGGDTTTLAPSVDHFIAVVRRTVGAA
jgi:hypothetical protein